MPRIYNKRKGKRSNYKRYMGYAQDTASLAGKALTIALATKKLLNVERKFKDTKITTTGISTGGRVDSLVLLSQGDGGSTRDGEQVKFVSILLKYILKIGASASATFFRVILVHDKQANGTKASITDYLEDISASDAIISPNNLSNKFRFRTLYDRVHSMSGTGNQTIHAKVYKTIDTKVRYSGNAGDETDLSSSNILIMLVSDEGVNVPQISYFARLRFVDN